MKYVFFGTPQFAAIIFKALIEAGFTPALVITAPDKPKGRGYILAPPPVKTFAKKYDIPVLQPTLLKNNEKLADAIAVLQPELFITAAYGKIIPKILLDIPKKGGLNIHPSLLPRYRGPSPIQAAILNGDETTGVTIMLMDEKMDHGPVLAQKKLSLRGANVSERRGNLVVKQRDCFASLAMTNEQLSEKLANLGAQLLIETIPGWLSGEIKPQPQDHAKATYTKIITKEDGRIDWRKSAEEIERVTRAYTPWPSAWTTINQGGKEKRIKMLKATVSTFFCHGRNYVALCTPLCIGAHHKSGTLIKQKSDLVIACGKDFLVVEELQVEGRKPMSGKEFLIGYRKIQRFY